MYSIYQVQNFNSEIIEGKKNQLLSCQELSFSGETVNSFVKLNAYKAEGRPLCNVFKTDITNWKDLRSITSGTDIIAALFNGHDRRIIRLPDNAKDYLAIYTTEYDDTYVLEPILSEDMIVVATYAKMHSEQQIENEMNFETEDPTASIQILGSVLKIRKLNKKIGENLKQLPGPLLPDRRWTQGICR